MAHRNEIIAFLDDFLSVARIRDASVNGLQVIGKDAVHTVALGVSASLELFERAVAEGADMLIVHHGLYWANTPRQIDWLTKRRLKALFDSDLTLLAYHLPLDAHPEVGNNAQILKALRLVREETPFGWHDGTAVGAIGRLPSPMSLAAFVKMVAQELSVDVDYLPYGPEEVSRVAVMSGGAPGDVQEAIEKGCDVYLTGEIREGSPAQAKEGHINYVGAGHYNTEKLGVIALGQLLVDRFGVSTTFIDIPNKY